jgi:hypothetical protein
MMAAPEGRPEEFCSDFSLFQSTPMGVNVLAKLRGR